MKDLARSIFGVLFDLRLVVGASGVLLSVVMHELFHIIMHWGEITSVNLFPDTKAIVEVLFIPTTHYNLVIEEALAYTITMATLILTAMLISDIHDAKYSKNVNQTVLASDFGNYYSKENEQKAFDHLSILLGIR